MVHADECPYRPDGEIHCRPESHWSLCFGEELSQHPFILSQTVQVETKSFIASVRKSKDTAISLTLAVPTSS